MKINGTIIKNPKAFKVERYKLTKSGRIASGLMTMDVIAKKRKFILTYEVISGADLKVIMDILDTTTSFYTFEYTEFDTTYTATVYPGALNYDRFRTNSGIYFKNFELNLIEK